MKSKFSSMGRVAIALVLALSLSLVMGAPVAANTTVPQGICFEKGMFSGGTADGVASWTKAVAGPITPPAGNYMAKLTYSASGAALCVTAAKVKYSGTLTDLSTLAGADESGMTFNYYYVDAGKNPYAALYLDTDDDGVADLALLSKRLDPTGIGTWHVAHPPLNGGGWHIYGYAAGVLDGTTGQTIKDVPYDSSTYKTLAGWAALDTDPATTTFGDDADVLYVGYMLGGNGGTNHIAYVDDITIGSTTYPLEPMVLTAEYYKTGDAVGVMVLNGNASGTTPAIFAKSDTVGEGGKITIALSETGTGTGVFTGGFQLVNTTPGPGQLLVNEGDSVDVIYTGDWGAGTQTLDWIDPPSATVDDTAPVITIVEPADSANITNAMPLIQADYDDAGSGIIDTTTAVMTLNGSPVTPDTATPTEITYTPGTELDDGSYTVTVDVSDKAGNAATQASWSFTVDTVAPVITLQVATPPVIEPDVENTIVFTATVTEVNIGTVTINLGSIGGSATEPMLDDGLLSDVDEGDGIYTTDITVTIAVETTYYLPVTATDLAGLSDTTTGDDRLELVCSSDIVLPVITDPAITYPFDMSSAMPSDTVTISANVTDDVGMGSVSAACDALTATVNLLDGGVDPDVTAGDDIYTGEGTVDSAAGWGDYTVTITAADDKGNEATDESLILAVRSGATGVTIDLVKGWNLISLPLIPDDADITVVISVTTLEFGDVSSVGIVRGYDPATGEFPYYMPETGSGDLTEMVDGVGYWVFMEEDDTLTITGREWPAPPEVPPTYDVVVGWNLIGFKSMEPMIDYLVDPEGGYLLNIAGTYPVLWSYDAVFGAYSNVKGVTDGMLVGHGFWIWITEAGTIVPPQ